MVRSNFRHLLYIGSDRSLQGGLGARIYIVGARNRTVFVAHGATDIKNRRAHPRWLQHYRIVWSTHADAHNWVESSTLKHLARNYTQLRGKQKSHITFHDGAFRFSKVGGDRGESSPKNNPVKRR